MIPTVDVVFTFLKEKVPKESPTHPDPSSDPLLHPQGAVSEMGYWPCVSEKKALGGFWFIPILQVGKTEVQGREGALPRTTQVMGGGGKAWLGAPDPSS